MKSKQQAVLRLHISGLKDQDLGDSSLLTPSVIKTLENIITLSFDY